MMETFDTDQPWVVYRYLSSDGETRFTGRSRIQCQCAICGVQKTLVLKIPRIGPVKEPKNGKHVARLEFLQEHLHTKEHRQNPMSWAMPLLNPAAHTDGIDLDLLAMRLAADIREAKAGP